MVTKKFLYRTPYKKKNYKNADALGKSSPLHIPGKYGR